MALSVRVFVRVRDEGSLGEVSVAYWCRICSIRSLGPPGSSIVVPNSGFVSRI